MITRALPDGPALRVARIVAGRSQVYTSGQTNIPLSRLRRLEAGQEFPTPEEVAAILGVLSSGE